MSRLNEKDSSKQVYWDSWYLPMPPCVYLADTRSFWYFTRRMGSKEPFVTFGICRLEMRGLIIVWGIFVEEQLEIAVTIFCTKTSPSNLTRKDIDTHLEGFPSD
jgi:hypothetical protein